jgi:ankyrin repeat protein
MQSTDELFKDTEELFKDLQNQVNPRATINVADNRGDTLLHQAARYAHKDIIVWLLEHGADVNGINKYGDTPLHEAARHAHAGHFDHTAISALLIGYGADVNVLNQNGNLPADIAPRDIAALLESSQARHDRSGVSQSSSDSRGTFQDRMIDRSRLAEDRGSVKE